MTPAAEALRLIVSSVPDESVADTIARTLVEERLAACVNILGVCRSIYRWQGVIESADVCTLLI